MRRTHEHGVERGRETCCFSAQRDRLSTWCGTGCQPLSFLCVCEILATVALVPVHLSCFGCYCRDQAKAKDKIQADLESEDCAGLGTGILMVPVVHDEKSTPRKSEGSGSKPQRGRDAEMQKSSTWCLSRSETRKASPLDYISQMCCDITCM